MKIVSSPVYLDTSALAKLYVPELESDALEAALLGRSDVIVSDLAVTELTSALSRRVREQTLAAGSAHRIYRQVLQDCSGTHFQMAQLTPDVHREAERLLMTLGSSAPLRGRDALHLASAVLAGAQTLITFDRHMRTAAAALGTLELAEPMGK